VILSAAGLPPTSHHRWPERYCDPDRYRVDPPISFEQVVLVLYQFCSIVQLCFRLARVSVVRD
jgi:hypothetical protein